MPVSQSKLVRLTPNLGILSISVCSLWPCGSIVANPIIYRLVPSPSRYEIRQYPYKGTKGNPWIDFLMCIMASGIARGRVRTTTTTTTTTMVESRNMAAMLQLMGWQKHACSVCIGSMPSFLSGIFKEKKNSSISTNYSGGWFNVF